MSYSGQSATDVSVGQHNKRATDRPLPQYPPETQDPKLLVPEVTSSSTPFAEELLARAIQAELG